MASLLARSFTRIIRNNTSTQQLCALKRSNNILNAAVASQQQQQHQQQQCRQHLHTSTTNHAAFVTQPAPDFKGTAVSPSGEFTQVQLSDYKDKYLVFFFYPLDFTFVCPTEIIAFSDRIQEFKDIGCEVLGCSVDSHFSHLAWTELSRKKGGLGKLNFPILSDLSKNISSEYGVLLKEVGISLRGLFIIDPKGVVRQITVNDLPVGRSVDETLRLIRAFQFNEEHGEVCPAGWNPGDDTIKPTVADSQEYFAKQ